MIFACYHGHIHIVNVLLENQAGIDHADNNGKTSLIWAINKYKFEVAEELIRRGCNINIQSNKGLSALTYTCVTAQFDVINLLLAEEGIEVDHVDKNGNTPIHYACAAIAKRPNPLIVEALLEKGAPVHPVNVQGASSLHFAAVYDPYDEKYGKDPTDEDVACIGISWGANLEHSDNEGCV